VHKPISCLILARQAIYQNFSRLSFRYFRHKLFRDFTDSVGTTTRLVDIDMATDNPQKKASDGQIISRGQNIDFYILG
jgi:hypothetical protein